MNHRTSIALISILKPVDDTRMFEKFGLSLGQTNKYDVNIIGFASKNIKKFDNIYFYPLFNFKRTSLMRLLAPWKILLLLLKVKPSVIVFNTPETLYVILIYKMLSGCKIIYDIQENYFRNVYFNKNYPLPIRVLLAYSIRFKEWSGRWLIDRIIFAEEGYRVEMLRMAKNAVVIKNTYKELDPDDSDFENSNIVRSVREGFVPENSDQTKIDHEGLNIEGSNSDNKYPDKFDLNRVYYKSRKKNDTEKFGDSELDTGSVIFLYSGTISDNYGIFTAIDFIEVIHRVDPSVNLLIVGYCANEKTYRKLIDRIGDKPYVILIGGNKLVPHPEIINNVRQADFGLICYDINPSTENCFPTKIYEYMANRLPIIIQNYKPWSSFCLKYNAGIEVDYKKFDTEKLLNLISQEKFYGIEMPDEIFWGNEEEKLLKLIKDIQS